MGKRGISSKYLFSVDYDSQLTPSCSFALHVLPDKLHSTPQRWFMTQYDGNSGKGKAPALFSTESLTLK